jgi:hypothetical protein
MLRLGLLGLLWFGGCARAFCDEPEEVVSSPDTQPGALQVGLELSTYGFSIAALHDGRAVCLTCDAVLTLDQQLQETGRTAASKPLQVAVGPDDSIYFLDRPAAKNAVPNDLVAYDPAGVVRWRSRLDGSYSGPIAASADTAYVERWVSDHDDPRTFPYAIFAFDAMTGEPRPLPLSQQRLLGSARGGVFTQEAPTDQTGPVTLRYIDRSGDARWTHTLTGALRVNSVVPTPNDGGIFVARAYGPVDLGDAKLELDTGSASSFVFELDATGATRWAFTVPTSYLSRIALLPDNQILLTGASTTPGSTSNGVLALATPTGIVRTHHFDGTFSINGLAVGAHGRAWLELVVSTGEDDPPPVLHIAGHTFTDTATYLFGIVP